MPKIVRIHAREILDSRGNPTLEVEVATKTHIGRASVPSGASTGSHEAFELRDQDERRFHGKGVLQAVTHVNTTIARKLKGLDPSDQEKVDGTLEALDGTENKSRLGANAILGVSLACAKVTAEEKGLPLFLSLNPQARLLPIPLINVINGGKHALSSGLDFQEFMIVPKGAPTFREALRMGAEIFHTLRKILEEKGYSVAVGDEGGFAPPLKSHEEALELLLRAIERAHYKAGGNVFLALDCAATEFFRNGKYELKIRGEKKAASADELITYYQNLVSRYPLVSIEDGCAEDDWDGWKRLSVTLASRVQLVGDDLFTTNPKRLEQGIKGEIANAILLKPNQIGTLTETIEVTKMAKMSGYATVMSHRSGETEDTTIAHLAVGLETGQIKTGSLSRSERVAKYNELLRIEELLSRKARFAKL